MEENTIRNQKKTYYKKNIDAGDKIEALLLQKSTLMKNG